jgi:hypothetical protein
LHRWLQAADLPHPAEVISEPGARNSTMIRNLTWCGLALIALITLLR